MTDVATKPDPIRDAYELAVIAAYDAARDPDIPLNQTLDWIDAAAFIGGRLGKTGDEVVTDCINYSIREMERSGEYE